MSWNFKITIRKSDTLFRQYLLLLRGERCEFCGQAGRVEVSHFYGRRGEATRQDPDNCQLLCSYHHRLFHERPNDYSDWMRKRMGEKEFKKLTVRANSYQKKDEKLAVIYWKQKLLELK